MKNYYICARGHVVLYSEKSENEQVAAVSCYGTKEQVTTLEIGEQLPSTDEQRNLYQDLRLVHFSMTGQRLLAVERLTTIPAPSIRCCPCGSGQPSWIEYSRFKHTVLCRVCDVCLPSKEEWIRTRRHL